jgi:hypothetical protein
MVNSFFEALFVLRHCTKINDTFIPVPSLYGRFSPLSILERGWG